MAQAGSNLEWQRWGETDPMFGVSNWSGKEAGSSEAWSEDEFFAMGSQDWADFRNHWQHFGLSLGVCLEIGCGAGRLTRALAADFEHVHGVDVAPGMLAKARSATEGLPVTLHEVDGLTLPLPDASIDAVFSTHVFQHLDSYEDAHANWSEAARVLRPGGTLMVHLPVHVWPAGLASLQSVYAAKRRVGDVRAAWRRRQMRRRQDAAPIMRGLFYDYRRLQSELGLLGFRDVQLAIFAVRSNEGEHTCVFARRG